MKSKSKAYRYTVFYEPDESGGYVAYVPILPGCVSQGDTFEEAQAMIRDAIGGYLAVLEEDGDPIPCEHDNVITAPLVLSSSLNP